MENKNCWENEDGTICIVKTEPEDVVSIEYNENGTEEQYLDYGSNNVSNCEQQQYQNYPIPDGFRFKQEGFDTGEDMQYQMESCSDQNGYYGGHKEGESGNVHSNWQYNNGFPPETLEQEQQLFYNEKPEERYEQPSTSDMSVFAEKREEKLYPCRYCDYVSNHPRYLDAHVNNRHTKSVVYQCPHCPYNSTIPRSTKDHIECKHPNECEKPMEIKRKCPFCDYSIANATVLRNHMNKHTGEKRHQCPFCVFNTLWEGYLKMHVRRKHSDQSTVAANPAKEYPCQYCDYKALTPSTLKLHTNKHTREQEHQCPYCPYKTVWTTYIKSHINNKHLKVEKAPIIKEHACSYCEYKAKNTTLLKQHMNKHTREKVHQCPHCPFSTLWLTYMKLHIKRKHSVKIEDGEAEKREFPCQYCDYKAISSSHLKIHENKHTKAVEYKCEQCDFKTSWYGYLKLHTKRKHTDEKPSLTTKTTTTTTYPCQFCPYKAINLSTLKVHQNKHTREVLYSCPHCDFKTTWRAYNKMHIAKHNAENFKTRKQSGNRRYACEYCDYVAPQMGALKLHVNSKHTRQVLHKCPQCDYQCAVYGNLKMHIRRRHGLKPEPDGKYHCKQCEYTSEKLDDYKLHLNVEHEVKMDVLKTDNTYTCQHCTYKTMYPQVMKKHINKHTRQHVIKCPHCSYTTVWDHYMKIHIKRHLEPKIGRQRFTRPNTDKTRLFPCQFCDHRSLSLSSLRDHINSIHTRAIMHKCPYCEHKCSLKGNLRGHIKRKHPNEFVKTERRYTCDRCDYASTNTRELREHLKTVHNIEDARNRTENGEYKCQYCEYKARTYYALKVHTNKHTKECSYQCPLCEFVTRWPNYLRKHIQQHALNKRKVSCLYCDYKGCSTFRLRKHIEELHKKDQYYHCPKSGCEFKTMHYPSLRIHLKGNIHANENGLRKSVTRNSSYKYAPNEERYFACDICEYASKTRSNLDLHIKNKHEKKRQPFKCEQCNYRTSSKNYLNQHLKFKHTVKNEIKTELDDDTVCEALTNVKVEINEDVTVKEEKRISFDNAKELQIAVEKTLQQSENDNVHDENNEIKPNTEILNVNNEQTPNRMITRPRKAVNYWYNYNDIKLPRPRLVKPKKSPVDNKEKPKNEKKKPEFKRVRMKEIVSTPKIDQVNEMELFESLGISRNEPKPIDLEQIDKEIQSIDSKINETAAINV